MASVLHLVQAVVDVVNGLGRLGAALLGLVLSLGIAGLGTVLSGQAAIGALAAVLVFGVAVLSVLAQMVVPHFRRYLGAARIGDVPHALPDIVGPFLRPLLCPFGLFAVSGLFAAKFLLGRVS